MGHNRAHDLVNRDEHYTPKWVFDALGIEFDLDVASPLEIEFSNVPAKKRFTIEDNGLTQDWSGNVWMNPPFSKVTPWVEKFIENGQGIALLVVSRSKWFRELWDIADGISITPYRMKFERPDKTSKFIAFQTMFFAMGKENVEALKNLEFRVR